VLVITNTVAASVGMPVIAISDVADDDDDDGRDAVIGAAAAFPRGVTMITSILLPLLLDGNLQYVYYQ
jgi:hypothetical protein